MPVAWKISNPPTYIELADLVCEMVEANIANLDGDHRFIRCFTFKGSYAPLYWHRAIFTRDLLITNKVVRRKLRKYHKKLHRMDPAR